LIDGGKRRDLKRPAVRHAVTTGKVFGRKPQISDPGNAVLTKVLECIDSKSQKKGNREPIQGSRGSRGNSVLHGEGLARDGPLLRGTQRRKPNETAGKEGEKNNLDVVEIMNEGKKEGGTGTAWRNLYLLKKSGKEREDYVGRCGEGEETKPSSR